MSSTKPPRIEGPSGEHPAVLDLYEQIDVLRENDMQRMARIRARLELQREARRTQKPPPPDPDPEE